MKLKYSAKRNNGSAVQYTDPTKTLPPFAGGPQLNSSSSDIRNRK